MGLAHVRCFTGSVATAHAAFHTSKKPAKMLGQESADLLLVCQPESTNEASLEGARRRLDVDVVVEGHYDDMHDAPNVSSISAMFGSDKATVRSVCSDLAVRMHVEAASTSRSGPSPKGLSKPCPQQKVPRCLAAQCALMWQNSAIAPLPIRQQGKEGRLVPRSHHLSNVGRVVLWPDVCRGS